MSDIKKGYCACCSNRVDYFKYAGNVKCLKCGAITIPTEKPKDKQHKARRRELPCLAMCYSTGLIA